MCNTTYNQLQLCSMLLEGKKVHDVAWTDKRKYFYFDRDIDAILDNGGVIVACTLAMFFIEGCGDELWEEY